MGSKKTCQQIETTTKRFGKVSGIPSQQERIDARNMMLAKIPQEYHSTLKFRRWLVISPLAPNAKFLGVAFHLSAFDKVHRSPLDFDNCCGDIKNPPPGLVPGLNGSIYKTKAEPTTTPIRTPLVPSNFLVKLQWHYTWTEGLDMNYVRSIYKAIRNNYSQRLLTATGPTVANLQKSIRHFDTLWGNRDYLTILSSVNKQLRYIPKQGFVETEKYLETFDETRTITATYTVLWKCTLNPPPQCCEEENNPIDCECQSQVFCNDFEDCESYQSCYGFPPECGFGAQSCCKDDCAEICSSDPINPIPCADPTASCIDNCCWYGNCRYGEWFPLESQICYGQTFTQRRIILRGEFQECDETERPAVGTRVTISCTENGNNGELSLNNVVEFLSEVFP